jgi:hypothetical protein
MGMIGIFKSQVNPLREEIDGRIVSILPALSQSLHGIETIVVGLF